MLIDLVEEFFTGEDWEYQRAWIAAMSRAWGLPGPAATGPATPRLASKRSGRWCSIRSVRCEPPMASAC